MLSKKSLLFRKKISLKFVEFMNQQNIDYLFLGHISNFPTKLTSDIDFFIDFKNFDELKKIIKKFTNKYKLNISNIIRHEYNSYYFILSKKINKEFYFIALDICNSYVIKSRELIKFKNLKKKTISKKKFKLHVLLDKNLFHYYILKKIYKNDINIQSFKLLKKIFLSLKKNDLEVFFDNNTYVSLIKIFNSNNIKRFKKESLNLKNKLILNKSKNLIENLKKILFRIKYKTGTHISILGLDGSGKTTQINLLKDSNFTQLFRNINVQHLFSTSKKNSKIMLPYKKNNYGYFFSLIKILYLYWNFLMNFVFIIYPKKIKSTLIINDRSFYDVIIDPYRYRIGKFHKFLNIIFKFMPEPDLTIYLDLNPKKLLSRKNELSMRKIIELTKKYQNVIFNCKYTKIRSDKKINIVNFEIKKNIIKLMNNKTVNLN